MSAKDEELKEGKFACTCYVRTYVDARYYTYVCTYVSAMIGVCIHTYVCMHLLCTYVLYNVRTCTRIWIFVCI